MPKADEKPKAEFYIIPSGRECEIKFTPIPTNVKLGLLELRDNGEILATYLYANLPVTCLARFNKKMKQLIKGEK